MMMIRQHSSNSLTLSKLGKLGSYATLCFGCHKKRLGAGSKRTSKMSQLMQIRMHVI